MIDQSQLSTAAGQDLTPEDVNLDDYLEDIPGGQKMLRLEYPFSVQKKENGGPMQDVQVDALTFRRLKAGDLDILAKSTETTVMKDMRALIAVMTDTLEPHIQKHLDADDFFRALVTVTGFFPKPKSHQTGATSPGN